jgi:hypothetical protein
MGAVGTRRVFEHLEKQGHRPIELERGSMSFKIWKNIKIKRIRVPDILCVGCGRRVESRAKTSLEISMSHSSSDPERGWDYGLNDEDFVALVACKQSGERPIDWQADELVQYVSVRDLRTAHEANLAILSGRKGAEEGFEERVIWPAIIAKSAGIVVSVKKEEYIQYRRKSDGRLIRHKLKPNLELLVHEGEEIFENQVLAAVVPVVKQFPCLGDCSPEFYIKKLSSLSLSERYAATKALSAFASEEVSAALAAKLDQSDEHIYVKIEAAASLARQDGKRGWDFLRSCLADKYLQHRLEAIIVLSEIPSDRSYEVLCSVLKDNSQHPEIRAGAAWALGELRRDSAVNVLIESFSAVEESIRIEAARALAKLASRLTRNILDELPRVGPDKRPGVAWALGKSGQFKLEDILTLLVDENTRRDEDLRHWVSYVLGMQEPHKYISEIEEIKQQDPEVYFAVTLLWKIMTSWVYNLEEY